jgi:hypothetical protein
MKHIKWLFAFMLFFTGYQTAFTQKQVILLTPAIKAEVVDSLSSILIKKYIYLDTAVKMSTRIKGRLKSGAYGIITNPDDFARILNTDLQNVYNDLHMRIYYDAGFEKALQTKSYMESVTRRMNFLQVAKQKNYGFPDVRILDGNIGYISITQFYDPNEQSIEVVKNVFNFLKNANSLIIDVRENPGGEPDMVKYICSYFFKEKTHLNDYYDRHTSTNQYFTTPTASSATFALMPVYILVNNHTYSAAEEFAYDLQSLHRATIIGQTTGGAAHWVSSNSISNGFIGNIPFRKAINPVTGKNWEKTGVRPNVNSGEKNTLNDALAIAYDYQVSTSKDSAIIKSIKWFNVVLNSKFHPFKINTAILKTYTGNYDGRLITLKKEQLYFTDTNGYSIGLIPISATAFTFTNNDRQLEFKKTPNGKITELNFIYQDGKIEKFTRLK